MSRVVHEDGVITVTATALELAREFARWESAVRHRPDEYLSEQDRHAMSPDEIGFLSAKNLIEGLEGKS